MNLKNPLSASELLERFRKKLEKDVAKIGVHPDQPQFWKRYSLGKIEGLDTSHEIYLRVATLQEWGLPSELICVKGWVYTPTAKIYEKFKKLGYELISLHPKAKTPLLFKTTPGEVHLSVLGLERRMREDHFTPPGQDEWFLPPDKS
ncbi:MAG: hypothetical protein PHE84_00395 [bacterium]|nr:hypothetical protein [bacterium]